MKQKTPTRSFRVGARAQCKSHSTNSRQTQRHIRTVTHRGRLFRIPQEPSDPHRVPESRSGGQLLVQCLDNNHHASYDVECPGTACCLSHLLHLLLSVTLSAVVRNDGVKWHDDSLFIRRYHSYGKSCIDLPISTGPRLQVQLRPPQNPVWNSRKRR